MSTTPTTTDLVYSSSSLPQRKEYAQALANAGELVPDGFRNKDGSPNPAKLLLAFEYGAMLGLHPVAALQGINVIKGKASPAPSLMTALIRRAGHKLRVKQSGVWPETFKVTVTIVRTDDPSNPFEATWDEAKARRAKLWPASDDSSWAKYPEAMCMWRAVSEASRMGAEDVMFGAHYVPEELGATVNEAGEVIEDAEIVEPERGTPDMVKSRGHANETRVTAASDRDATPAPAQESTPSRTVDLSGAGRDNPPAKKPPTGSATSWIRDINATADMGALIELRQMAVAADALGMKTPQGISVDSAFNARREELTQPEPVVDVEYVDDPDQELPF